MSVLNIHCKLHRNISVYPHTLNKYKPELHESIMKSKQPTHFQTSLTDPVQSQGLYRHWIRLKEVVQYQFDYIPAEAWKPCYRAQYQDVIEPVTTRTVTFKTTPKNPSVLPSISQPKIQWIYINIPINTYISLQKPEQMNPNELKVVIVAQLANVIVSAQTLLLNTTCVYNITKSLENNVAAGWWEIYLNGNESMQQELYMSPVDLSQSRN